MRGCRVSSAELPSPTRGAGAPSGPHPGVPSTELARIAATAERLLMARPLAACQTPILMAV